MASVDLRSSSRHSAATSDAQPIQQHKLVVEAVAVILEQFEVPKAVAVEVLMAAVLLIVVALLIADLLKLPTFAVATHFLP